MLLSLVAVAASVVSVQAFKDTSPFILFSNSQLPDSLRDVSTQQLQSKSTTLDYAKKFLSTCPSDNYYIINQPGVTYEELSSSAPHLKTALSNPAVHARYLVSEVVGLNATDASDLASFIEVQCGAQTVGDVAELKQRKGPQVFKDSYPIVPSGRTAGERAEIVADTDASLYPLLDELPSGQKYTFIYTTSPSSFSVPNTKEATRYESQFDEAVHMDLKRNLQVRARNTTGANLLPLFEKYAFFSPGIFMGLLVGFVLLAILSVGMSALGSLQVSYGAFDKEMGPAAQKKQQ